MKITHKTRNSSLASDIEWLILDKQEKWNPKVVDGILTRTVANLNQTRYKELSFVQANLPLV